MKFLAALLAVVAQAHAQPVSVRLPAQPPRPPAAESLDVDRMLLAIEQAENTPYYKVGASGERSVYQITEAVWRTYSAMPFQHASSNRVVCIAEARRVALRHVEHLRAQLVDLDLPDRPFWIALAYGAGLDALYRNAASAAKRSYASRVHQLYFAQ